MSLKTFVRSRSSVIVLFVVVVVGVVGALAYRHHHRYKHLAVHDSGMVYRSAWLEPDVMKEVIEKYQIRTVVNLCAPGEMGEARWDKERQTVYNAGARLLELSMPSTIDPSHPDIEPHVNALDNPDHYPMLVHCQHGVTRTAKFLAMYDILHRGMSAEESLSSQPLFGRDDHNVHVRAFAHKFEEQKRKQGEIASSKKLDALRR